MLGQDFNVLAKDKPYHDKAKKEIDAQLEGLTKMDILSPEGKAEYRKVRKNVLDRYSQFGDIGSMQGNLATHQAYQKEFFTIKHKEYITKKGKDHGQ